MNNKKDLSLGQHFWNDRWENGETGWDIGFASPAITDFMDQFPNKDAAILIPGCGNAYEAEYLVENSFTDITLIDIAPIAVKKLKAKFENSPQVKILCEDFFLHQGSYDLIIEQTFFCALPPSKRKAYAKKVSELLNTNGKTIGVLFDKVFERPGPPFGGHTDEYEALFSPHLNIKTMDKCYNSIGPRKDSEVFIIMIKKS